MTNYLNMQDKQFDQIETLRTRNPELFRTDGSPKGTGYFGILKNSQGQDVTEFSVGVDFGGKQVEIPTLVPTLSKQEVQSVLDSSARGELPEQGIMQKAIQHAQERIQQGNSPFKVSGDLPQFHQ